MDKELISVIIPIYNVEKYLNKCIESVVNQTYKNIEIILVDDGSTDASSKMCDEWKTKDSRIEVIHKENGGLSSARNAGIAIAKGDYIGYVDSDDWIAQDMYEVLYNLIKENKCQISICGIQRTDESSETSEEERIIKYSQKEYIKKILKIGTQNSNQYAWNKLYDASIVTNDIYPDGFTDEDVEGTFKALLKSDCIVETTRKCYYYRIENDGSITAPIFNEHRMDYLTICDHVMALAYTTGDDEIVEWAKLFRYRADFGVLSRLAVMKVSDDMKDKVEEIKNELVTNLRKHYRKLIQADIPLSRKILITCFCLNYDITARLLKKKNVKVK